MTEQKKFTIVPIMQTVVTGFKKVPVYDFDELSEDVQQRLIDDYDIEGLQENFFDFEIDFYIDGIKQDIWQKYNLPVSSINYDLSYCQGSGATFVTDVISDKELEKFIKKTFPDFVKSFRSPDVLFPYFCECTEVEFRTGRCASYNNVNVGAYFNPDAVRYIDTYLTDKVYQLEKMLKSFSSDLTCKITRKLYDLYENSYSESAIKNMLSCSLYFENGDIAE